MTDAERIAELEKALRQTNTLLASDDNELGRLRHEVQFQGYRIDRLVSENRLAMWLGSQLAGYYESERDQADRAYRLLRDAIRKRDEAWRELDQSRPVSQDGECVSGLCAVCGLRDMVTRNGRIKCDSCGSTHLYGEVSQDKPVVMGYCCSRCGWPQDAHIRHYLPDL